MTKEEEEWKTEQNYAMVAMVNSCPGDGFPPGQLTFNAGREENENENEIG